MRGTVPIVPDVSAPSSGLDVLPTAARVSRTRLPRPHRGALRGSADRRGREASSMADGREYLTLPSALSPYAYLRVFAQQRRIVAL